MKSVVRLAPLAVVVALAFGCSTQQTSDSSTSNPSSSNTSSSASAQPAPGQNMSGSQVKDAKTAAMLAKHSVYYDFDKSNISPEGRALIEAHARYLREHPDVKVRIEGNADERGTTEYNVALGQQRSSGVLKMMTLLGVPEGRIEAVSLGKEKPKATGHDEQSWAENRRSDIVYK